MTIGMLGENLACEYLEQQGYKILARNFRCHRYGEIDIVAGKDNSISFIEVKARSSLYYGRPEAAVTWAKKQKIMRCAQYFLQLNGYHHYYPRLSFDCIAIVLEGSAVIDFKHYIQCFNL